MNERVAQQEGINEQFRAATQSHEEKLATVEAHHAKHDAWLKELQQGLFTASAANSSAPTGAADPAGVAAVRVRLHQHS